MAKKGGEPDRSAERAAFGRELDRVMRARDISQDRLAGELDVAQPTVSAWLNGTNEPNRPWRVFRLERILQVPPGHLSRFLGYVPVDADKVSAATFEQVVRGDPLLPAHVKKTFVEWYQSFRPKS